ncbi:MAG: hypothetical protein KGJ02_07965 [Verrucomicrobiota bacterium]|nr:hypothetical protein [Verrucomicrobiota bacterium]
MSQQIVALPSCSGWRFWHDPEFPENEKIGTWTHIKTGRVYGFSTRDTPWELRKKFFPLCIFTFPGTAARIAYRTLALLSGDFIRSGLAKGEAEWQLKSQEWSLNSNRKIEQLPSHSLLLIKHILRDLVLNVLKIVTYPLACIALQFTALYGLLDPINGRAAFSRIEEIWSRDISSGIRSCGLFIQFSEFSAPCMQPKDVWEKNNLFAYRPHYDPHSSKSLFLQIQNIFKKKEKIFVNEKIDIQRFQTEIIENYRNQYQKIRKSVKITNESSIAEPIKNPLDSVLESFIQDLESIQRLRAEIVKKYQASPSSSCNQEMKELDKHVELINNATPIILTGE